MTPRDRAQDLINGLHDRGLFERTKAVAAKHHVTVGELLSKRRFAQFSDARHEVCYVFVSELGFSYPRIGALLGLDPTSVIHAVRKHARLVGDETLSGPQRVNRPSP
jgi:chromosomal replication initiation ATPase DnaA